MIDGIKVMYAQIELIIIDINSIMLRLFPFELRASTMSKSI